MAAQIFLPRLAERAVEEALADTPVVLVHGPRQCGKTTLTKRVGGRLGYEYFTLDHAQGRIFLVGADRP
jgi:predicted AAA+ superfamily ATPase